MNTIELGNLGFNYLGNLKGREKEYTRYYHNPLLASPTTHMLLLSTTAPTPTLPLPLSPITLIYHHLLNIAQTITQHILWSTK